MYIEIDKDFLEKHYDEFVKRGKQEKLDGEDDVLIIESRSDSEILNFEKENRMLSIVSSNNNIFLSLDTIIEDYTAMRIAKYLKEKAKNILSEF